MLFRSAMNQANKEADAVSTAWENVKKGDEYKNAAKALQQLKLAEAKNKKDGTAISPRVEAAAAEANRILNDEKTGLNTVWKKKIENADRLAKQAEAHWKNIGASRSGAKAGNSANSNDPFGLR